MIILDGEGNIDDDDDNDDDVNHCIGVVGRELEGGM